METTGVCPSPLNTRTPNTKQDLSTNSICHIYRKREVMTHWQHSLIFIALWRSSVSSLPCLQWHIYPTHLSVTNQHLMNLVWRQKCVWCISMWEKEAKRKEKDNRGRAIRSLSLKIAFCPGFEYTLTSCKRKHMKTHSHYLSSPILSVCHPAFQITCLLFIFHSAFITLLICCLLVITLVSCCQFAALCSILFLIISINNILQKSSFVFNRKIKVIWHVNDNRM